ncbi:PASTA domain-containing protein [Rhodocytophaga rosea]|uniref:PASTA domain-containing protein n=1 Tax=Rhodocytophaga rosea TaxID=2704465 RepID=A0A6C0GG60_9BACT|nr:PASTA domain-containing protein [Rhodocytophaga rosea]QHT66814.1 PASTA domain-containing protein [Rhodocytophaga rosea]
MIYIKTSSKKDVLIHIGIMLSLLAIIVLSFFFIYLPSTTNHGESITVPDLSGMKVDAVEEFLESRDLRYEINDSTFISNKPASIVLTQYPKAGEKVKENRKIYITVTTNNPPNVEMPKLVDISLKSAQMLLQSYELQEGSIKYVPNLAQNLVLKQEFNGKEIAPGTKLPKGSKIDLTVGDGVGKDDFTLQNVVGMTLEEAKVVIEGSSLVIGSILYDGNSSEPTGTVIKQNPAADSNIRVGEVVDLWVSGTGPDTNE